MVWVSPRPRNWQAPIWAGRAIGVQNTGQNVMALAVAPAFATVVTALTWPWALAAAATLPALAVWLTPVRGETLEAAPAPVRGASGGDNLQRSG